MVWPFSRYTFRTLGRKSRELPWRQCRSQSRVIEKQRDGKRKEDRGISTRMIYAFNQHYTRREI